MTADKTVKALEVPRLVVMLADGKEVHHHLSGRETTIGRDPSNKICLPDHFVSKFHAKLVQSGAEPAWVLTDLGSANKTYVNGEPITEATVRYGDTLKFASVQCRLAAPEVAEKPQAPTPVSDRAAAPPAPVASAPAPAAPAAPASTVNPPPRPSVRATPRPRAGSNAPKIEDDPMKRLLKIGAILILLSLVLGIVLRILLVPSESPPAQADTGSKGGTATAGAGPIPPDAASTAADGSTGESGATGSPRPPSLDASGNRTADFYFDEALSYLDTGKLKEAQASFRKVIDLDPDHSRAKTRLSLLDEEIEAQAQAHFDNAREAFQFLRYEEAIAEWEMFLLLADPGDVRYAEAQQGIEQAQSRLR